MKHLLTLIFILPAILLSSTVGNYERVNAVNTATDPTPATASPTPVGAMPPIQDSIPALTDGQPIHMPDLIGRSLEYATGIWDNDEELPQFRVERLSNGVNLVVVRQQPAPGTLIVPSQALIELTLGEGPVIRPKSSPTPLPSSSSINSFAEALGQATLLRAPYVQNLTTTSVTIVWTSMEDGASEVHYGISNYTLIALATSTYFTTPAAAPYDHYYIHQATLNGLTADTVYQYKIFTNGADLTPGGSVTFRTAKPTTTSSFRFAVFGDSGDGSQNQKDVATRLLQVQPDLALHTGDLIYPEASYDNFETKFFQIYQDLLKGVWLAPSMGNHDVTYNNGKSFTDVFVNPPNAANPSERELYYSFDYGNAHFVVLNNYFAMSTVGSAQYNWLVNDLAASSQFWKFVVFHEPAYATDSSQQPRDGTNIVKNLVPLFEQYNVDIVLNGHWHDYERMYPLLGGQVSTIEAGGVVYVVTGGGGAGLISIGTGTLNQRTAAKFQKFHLTMLDITTCSLQLSAVQKVSGTGDTFDASDVFDTYTINRCGVPLTPTPTVTNTSTITPGPSPTSTPTNTPTPTPMASSNPLYASFTSNGSVAGVSFNDEDIMKFDGSAWSLFFDGSDVGVGGTDLFAFSIVDSDTLLMSFGAALTLNGLNVTPQDVVRFDATSLGSVTAGTFSMYLNGIDVGLDTSSENIDAVSLLPDGRVLISTTGNPSVPGVSGSADEDILAFTATTLGDVTSGTWAMYFDGSDVGLADSSNEDVDALDVDPNGAIYLSTTGDFSVTGVAGFDEDVFICSPSSLGSVTACAYSPNLYFDGSTWGQAANDVDAFDTVELGTFPTVTPSNTATPTPTNTPGSSPTSTPTIGPSPTPTDTSTSTPTFTPTNTPGPSNTPTETPTVTPTAAVSDLIFADGFENGSFSAWSSVNNGGGDLSVNASAALVGSNGMQVVVNDTTTIYTTDNTPNAEPHYRARFYFDPNSISMTDGNAHYIFMGYDASAVFNMDFRISGGNYQIRLRTLDDSQVAQSTAWVTISDAPHSIEMEWLAASAIGANNGGANLWIDNVQSGSVSGMDNDTRRIDSVRLGAVAGVKAGTLGTYYIDAFESRRQTYIGP